MLFDWAKVCGTDHAVVQRLNSFCGSRAHHAAPGFAHRQATAPLADAAAPLATIFMFYKLGKAHSVLLLAFYSTMEYNASKAVLSSHAPKWDQRGDEVRLTFLKVVLPIIYIL